MSIYRKSYTARDGTSAKTATYYVEFRDHLARTQVVSAYQDKASSRELERKLVKLVALHASGATLDERMRRWVEELEAGLRDRLAEIGIISASQVAALRPLTGLVDSWAEHLRAKGTTERQVRLVKSRALRVVSGTKAKFWNDLSPDRVEQYLRGEREKEKRFGVRTSNFHLGAVRQFCGWAVRTGLASEDPLRRLEPLNAETDRRLVRRALTSDELRKLVKAAAEGPEREGMIGAERALLYRLASETGLRRGELLQLVVGDFDVVDVAKASVVVQAKSAKNRRAVRLPLRPALARDVESFVKKRTPLAAVFSVSEKFWAAKCLRADLVAAGIAPVDGAGRVADFHALRTTFGTNLARGGVPLQVAQKLMRHSTPTLTSNVYTVLGRDDERAGVDALPDTSSSSPVALAATGTDGGGTQRNDLQADFQGSARTGGSARDSAGLVSGSSNGRGTQADGRLRGQSVGGGSGIRTLGDLAATPVFKTGPLDHSGNPPPGRAP